MSAQHEWDLEQIYDEQISPLMKQIFDICEAHKMPMLASFHIETDVLCTTALSFSKERGEYRFHRALAEIPMVRTVPDER